MEKIKLISGKDGMAIYPESKVFPSGFKKRFFVEKFSGSILPSAFRKWFFIKLSEGYDLYEYLKGEKRLLTAEIIENSADLSETDLAAYKKCYELDHVYNDFSFAEFLEIVKIEFADIYVFNKGLCIDQNNFENTKTTKINLQPDGDVDCMWIEKCTQDFELCVTGLIEQYNSI